MNKLEKITLVIEMIINCRNAYSIHDAERLIIEEALRKLNKLRIEYRKNAQAD